jgi:hypothetical protein
VLDATNDYALVVDDDRELAGVPADVVAEARAAAEADGRAGWKLTLRMPCYLPVMQYADSATLRATLHRAYSTRASELGARAEWDNTALLDRILALRAEEARLLGFANFAELSLCRKMANDPAEVLAFLRDLAAKARPYARRDIDELAAFARDELGLAALAPWDLAWASEAQGPATPSPSRRCGSTSPSRRCWPGCSASSGPSTACAFASRRRRPGIRRSASSPSKVATASRSASSTSTSTRAPTSRAARGWTTRSTAVASATGCSTRSPT